MLKSNYEAGGESVAKNTPKFMGDIKYSQQADGLGYLYRAAFYLARGEKAAAVLFLQKAVEKINAQSIQALRLTLSELSQRKIKIGTETTIVAEKILDEYKKTLLFATLNHWYRIEVDDIIQTFNILIFAL